MDSDDCLSEPLVYSESENSEDETQPSIIKPSGDLSFISQALAKEKQSNETKDDENSNESDAESLVSSRKLLKKKTAILSSDEEGSNNGRDESEKNDSPSEKQDDSDESTMQMPTKSVIRPSICDSDTKSSDAEEPPIEILKKKKKFIKKIKKQAKQKKKNIASDASGSASDSSDEDSVKKSKNKSSKNEKHSITESSGSGSSGSDSNQEQNETTEIKPREKPKQRMSAKVAEDQMKEIQSESQRLAREAYINVPYHKPKQYSLKEFLNRRSIQHHEQVPLQPTKKTAAAIKMSEEELIIYAKKLEEREKESQTFFKEDDSESEANDVGDVEAKSEEITNVSEEPSQIDAVLNKPENEEIQNNENMDVENPMTEEDLPISSEVTEFPMDTDIIDTEQQPEKIETTPKPIEFHTEQTELDLEIDQMIVNERKNKLLQALSGTVNLGSPKLSGGSGMIIDLESNEVKPKEKSGVEKLVERFVKNALVKSVDVESKDIGIFHTESGTIEKHKVLINDDHKLKKEPKPGESFFKLKSELSRKIDEKRREAVYKRLEEEQKQKEINGDEDEEEEEMDDNYEEYSDCGQEDNDETEMVEDDKVEKNEIEETEQTEKHLDDSDESDDSDEPDETDNLGETDGTCKRRRILTAFNDDSDEESTANTFCAQTTTQNSSEPKTNDLNQSADIDDILALNKSSDSLKQLSAPKLFENENDDEEIGESQLMALCSGAFVTQQPNNEHFDEYTVPESQANNAVGPSQMSENIEISRPRAILSSDEENEPDTNDVCEKKKKKKKKQNLVFSDDEDDDDQEKVQAEEDADEASSEIDEECVADEEEDLGEKYVEYDSDENEIEVVLKKEDVKKKAKENFLENEAELSESEWGSDDEAENGMDVYEPELGDADEFDQSKIQSELERIRLRQQIDQDAKEVRILTERFIEEEDNGQERERKFRWKHLDNMELGDGLQTTSAEPEEGQIGSDDENEEEWRRQRYEREQKLKEESEKRAAAGDDTTVIAESVITDVSIEINSMRRISIIKPLAAPKVASPFLITQTALTAGHLSRKSFLNRDTTTLAKLAGLTKSGADGETIVNTAKGKGNYVFVATEKKNESKRKSDTDFDLNNGASSSDLTNPRKKSKLTSSCDEKIRPQTKTFLDLLSK